MPKNAAQAVEFYSKGCAGGNALGCGNLGTWHYVGGEIAKDLKRAQELFRKACDLGDSQSCTNLGMSYQEGEGVPQDQARSVSLFERACDPRKHGWLLQSRPRLQRRARRRQGPGTREQDFHEWLQSR